VGDHFIDADVGLDPPFVGFLVDLALADDEARVQPAVVAADLAEKLDTGKDGPTDPDGVSSWTLWPCTETRISTPSSVRMTPRRLVS
jgi:hypothetical protein